jgi:hypothetical protein
MGRIDMEGGCASGFLGGLVSGTFSTARGLSGQMLSHTELARIHRRPFICTTLPYLDTLHQGGELNFPPFTYRSIKISNVPNPKKVRLT